MMELEVLFSLHDFYLKQRRLLPRHRTNSTQLNKQSIRPAAQNIPVGGLMEAELLCELLLLCRCLDLTTQAC